MKKNIANGVFYTPDNLVAKSIAFLKTVDDETIFLDAGAGSGQFTNAYAKHFLNNKILAYEIDENAAKAIVNAKNVVIATKNLLHDFNLDLKKTIVIGNPPYRNLNSLYKRDVQTSEIIDEEYKAPDIGLSFLKLFNFHQAKEMCLILPMTFFLKKNNFRVLKDFKYSISDALIFNATMFPSLKINHPLVLIDFVRSEKALSWEDVLNYNFKFIEMPPQTSLNDEIKLKKAEKTVKYAALATVRDAEIKIYKQKDDVPTGLWFYTLRDMRALLRNATFLTKPNNDAIVVDGTNFYQYAYLDWLKAHFLNLDDCFLFTNYAPIYFSAFVEKYKTYFVNWALENNDVVKNFIAKNSDFLNSAQTLNRPQQATDAQVFNAFKKLVAKAINPVNLAQNKLKNT